MAAGYRTCVRCGTIGPRKECCPRRVTGRAAWPTPGERGRRMDVRPFASAADSEP